MYCLMVSGTVTHMSNNAGVAGREMDGALKLLYPQADRKRAVEAFMGGHSVTVGCIAGLVS